MSQTDGEDLPTLTKQLTGNIEEYERFFRALKNISPVPIELENIDGGANGYYHLTEKRIAVRNDLSEMQTIKTAMSVTCSMDVKTVGGVKNTLLGGEGVFNTIITGPGKVYLQTMPMSRFAATITRHLPSGKR